MLNRLAGKISHVPDSVPMHPRVAKVYEDRVKMAAGSLRIETLGLNGVTCGGDTMVALFDSVAATPLWEDDLRKIQIIYTGRVR